VGPLREEDEEEYPWAGEPRRKVSHRGRQGPWYQRIEVSLVGNGGAMGLVPRVRAPRPPGAELSLPELALGGGGELSLSPSNVTFLPTPSHDQAG
jgi:hypothetical protein